MKKFSYVLITTITLLLVFSSCSKNNKSEIKTESVPLNVVCYSSFAEDWGAGGDIAKKFEEETGIKVNLINAGSGAELVGYIKDNKGNADVVVGISDDYINGDVSSYIENPTVFDYSYYTFLQSKDSGIATPHSLFDLTKSEYNKQFILIDPRTSSVGLGGLYWTKSALGDDFITWWKEALSNALTVASSWSEGYGLFLNGEAPLVLSYTTSPWYDIAAGDDAFSTAIDFDDGHIKCEEYMAVVSSSSNKENANKFIEFMLTPFAQKKLSDINVMYPVSKDESLRQIFDEIKEPHKVIEKDKSSNESLIDYWSERIL